MFEHHDAAMPGDHHVLLDGGYGSFGLSVIHESATATDVAGWAWSSDLPHHVVVNPNGVQVVRWDAPDDTHTYSLDSITRDIDAFHRFLCRDRVKSNRTVVQHLVNLFGTIRSLVHHTGLPDQKTIDAFVTVLADLVSDGTAHEDPLAFGLPEDSEDLREHLRVPTLHKALEELQTAPTTLSTLTLHPSLAIRHAGGQLFQEAHFDLVRAPSPDMFGYMGAAQSARNTTNGTHFTPPALARAIVDYTLKQIDGLSTRDKLTVSDPACGAGAFLHEALRGLRRAQFNGSLHMVGSDISRAAVTMANFALKLALRDWEPAGGATISLSATDSLNEPEFPPADLVVMNPPFISFVAQTKEQKAQLLAAVGPNAASRGDYSMAFIKRGLESLSDGGAMGTLFPANLLVHEASSSWRHQLIDQGDLRLLASIGDFGLFSQALVQVAIAVIRKSEQRSSQFSVLVTENEPRATGHALRELRKSDGRPPVMPRSGVPWRLFPADTRQLHNSTWRILTPQQRLIVDALAAAQMPTVNSLFDIAQGIQTGRRDVFLLDELRYSRLPPKERNFFRKALMTDSITDGGVVRIYYLFFPHSEVGPIFSDETAVAQALPTYFRTVLKPNEQALRNRASLVRAGRHDWWGLMHPRKYSFDHSPRIISKFFGTEGSFVFDETAEYLPSTGHVWWSKVPTAPVATTPDLSTIEKSLVLRAYTTLLNSRIFIRLVSLRSPILSGGQFDLSRRFVGGTFIPNLWEKATDPMIPNSVEQMARACGGLSRVGSRDSRLVDQLVVQVYGVPRLAEI